MRRRPRERVQSRVCLSNSRWKRVRSCSRSRGVSGGTYAGVPLPRSAPCAGACSVRRRPARVASRWGDGVAGVWMSSPAETPSPPQVTGALTTPSGLPPTAAQGRRVPRATPRRSGISESVHTRRAMTMSLFTSIDRTFRLGPPFSTITANPRRATAVAPSLGVPSLGVPSLGVPSLGVPAASCTPGGAPYGGAADGGAADGGAPRRRALRGGAVRASACGWRWAHGSRRSRMAPLTRLGGASVVVSTTHAASRSRASWARRTPCTRESGGAPSSTTRAKTPLRSSRSAHQALRRLSRGRTMTSRSPNPAKGAGASVRPASIHATQPPVRRTRATT